jgi:hypothetical protein
MFFGILIRMYFNDHPPPHFHARYNEDEAVIAIEIACCSGGISSEASAFAGARVGGISQNRACCRLGALTVETVATQD